MEAERKANSSSTTVGKLFPSVSILSAPPNMPCPHVWEAEGAWFARAGALTVEDTTPTRAVNRLRAYWRVLFPC